MPQPPSPPQSPSPGPTRPTTTVAASDGAERSGSSRADSSADWIADAGPAFDPRAAPAPPTVELDEPEPDGWDVERIREGLELAGETAHWLFNGGPEDEETWLMTQQDLRAIAPPLTRVLNRYDATRAAAAAGDEALLTAALVRYGARNYTRRRYHIRQTQAAGPRPVTGVPAPAGTGPESDPEWQRVHDLGEQPLEQTETLDTSPPDLPARGGRR